MRRYRLVGFINQGTCRWFMWETPLRTSIDAVCGNCTNDLLLIQSVEFARPRAYYWVERRSRKVLAEFHDRDAAEMAGHMLAGN